ncbi:Bifunctional coenzyme A synthase [Frankliniella fusca]|uniref:Bifunctional coenzyme A synthase n=1 Tax=Frankliniella fusca TaxID=407009 RepID=A0AAE1GVA9_9NEOP|nr:Bifunctional coenzyme A synthase [Frankliniella fusca]
MVLVLSAPISGVVPVAVEAARRAGVLRPESRVLGVPAVAAARAAAVVGALVDEDPFHISVPITGGTSSSACVPLVSQVRVQSTLTKLEAGAVVSAVQAAGGRLARLRAENSLPAMGVAYAAARFTDNVMNALLGEASVREHAFVACDLVSGVPYLTAPVELHRGGARVLPLGPMTGTECELLRAACRLVQRDLDVANDVIETLFGSQDPCPASPVPPAGTLIIILTIFANLASTVVLSSMAKTGLLVVTNPSRVAKVLPDLQKHLLNKLYIQYLPQCLSRLLTPTTPSLSSPSPTVYSKTVIGMYSQSLGHNIDVAILLACLKNPMLSVIHTKKPIDVVFFDRVLSGDEMNAFLKKCLANVTMGCTVVSLDTGDSESQQPETAEDDKIFDNVVLGGTFDRLHTGHKILLSEAVLRCRRKMTVGVTDASMLKSKYLSELIEPCEDRMSHVLEFLQEVDPNIEYNVVPISDPFGPTKDDPTFEVMIVVSEETLKGGLKINEVRAQKSLNPLAVHSVNLLVTSNKQEQEEEDKVSSGNLRLRVLGTRLIKPEPRPNLPAVPYIIGLTGGIASGKSSVARRLEEMGAGLVDCDSLAHTLYRRGEPLQDKLVEYFGSTILDAEGEVDRKVLGSLVFGAKEKLTALNNMVWPALWERTKLEISKLHSSGKNIIVVEAAVLRQAGWQQHCHEIWVSIIPPEEAVRRLKDRNNLSEEAAWARVSAQSSNAEQVKGATTVLSTLWSYDFTQRQVTRAWRHLHAYLEKEGFARGNKL